MTAHQEIRVNDWGDTVDHHFFLDSADLETTRKHGIEQHGKLGEPHVVDALAEDFTVGNESDHVLVGFRLLRN